MTRLDFITGCQTRGLHTHSNAIVLTAATNFPQTIDSIWFGTLKPAMFFFQILLSAIAPGSRICIVQLDDYGVGFCDAKPCKASPLVAQKCS